MNENTSVKIKFLEETIKKYEENGIAKLYYSLSRKAWEMADLLNKVSLSNLALDDKNDKTFERLKVVWNDAANIATAIDSLGKLSKVTGNEDEDVNKKPFVDTIAESRK